MEPHELDKYVANQLREAENSGGEGEKDGMNRVWSAIEPQIEKRASFQWVRMAALILLLLMPSVYLYLRNRDQGRQILLLNTRLSLMDRDYRQKLLVLSANQPEKVIIQHDTVRLVKTVEKKVLPEIVETVKYVTDTVIVYPEEPAMTKVGPEPSVPPSGQSVPAWQESPAKTEYILSKDTSTKKKKKSHSFQISLGPGNNTAQTGTELAFKTKL
jgi:hypothetical protein